MSQHRLMLASLAADHRLRGAAGKSPGDGPWVGGSMESLAAAFDGLAVGMEDAAEHTQEMIELTYANAEVELRVGSPEQMLVGGVAIRCLLVGMLAQESEQEPLIDARADAVDLFRRVLGDIGAADRMAPELMIAIEGWLTKHGPPPAA